MAALTNLSFETAGASAGLAASWAITGTSSIFEYAGFNAGTAEEPWETFEVGWAADPHEDTLEPGVNATRAVFGAGVVAFPPGVEDFEAGWDTNHTYFRELPAAAAAQFDGESREDFEDAWSNPGTTEFGSGALAFVPTEDFETGWRSNETSLTVFAPGDLEAAVWDATRVSTIERFEFVKAPTVCFAANGPNTFTATAHGLQPGYRVTFAVDSGEMPTGLRTAQPYYVLAVPDADTFTVSLLDGGTITNFGSDGTGVLRFTAAWEHWTAVLPNL